jgi:two-component system cell cycle sensor histidine kinase/response regulator CckA
MTETPSAAARLSLRWQLVALMAGLALPLLALQAWWSAHDYQTAREHAEANALAVADAMALGVLQFFRQAEELMTAAALNDSQEWLAPDTCSDRVGDVRTLLPFLHNAIVVGPDGSVTCSALPAPAGASAEAWPWFQGVRTNPVFTLGVPVEADFTGDWILPLIAPLPMDDGAFGGAVVGTVALVELSRLFGSLAIPEDHLVTVATSDRVVIARSSDPEGRVGQALPPVTGSDREVAPGRWVATGPDLNGIPRTWGQVEIDPGWIVYVGVPDDRVFGPARSEALAHVGATLLVVLLGMLFAGRSYRRIAAALRELAQRTRAAAEGEAVPLPPDTPVEVSEVVRQFNQVLGARARAQSAERMARKRFESLFDNAVVGLYVSTLDGRFLQVNRALVEMLAFETEVALLELGPEPLYVDPTERTRLVERAQATGAVAPVEADWLRADGVPITVRLGGKLIPGPTGEPVFEMIVQDVTEEKRTEDQLRQTQKMEAIGKLAGGIAHDFNNILTVIGGNVELLEGELPAADPMRDDLRQISAAATRGASLTRRLLAFSRKQRSGRRIVDVNEVIPDLSKMLVPILGETIHLEVDSCEESLPVEIDPAELEQVILNLVLNARDAMPRGGQLRVTTRLERGWTHPDGNDLVEGGRIESPEVESDRTAGTVALSVQDTGVGIAPESHSRIFEPFYTTKPMGEGTGLGLSTVYGIVSRAGGSVDVQSEPGHGATLTVRLPVSTSVESGETPTEVEATGPATGRVLVVEDDAMVRRFVERALSEGGYRVRSVASGAEALQVVKAEKAEIDLVLTDLVMPGVSGHELASRLAIMRPATPILYMSGYADRQTVGDDFEPAEDGILRKPFAAADLRSAVRRAIDRSAVRTLED